MLSGSGWRSRVLSIPDATHSRRPSLLHPHSKERELFEKGFFSINDLKKTSELFEKGFFSINDLKKTSELFEKGFFSINDLKKTSEKWLPLRKKS